MATRALMMASQKEERTVEKNERKLLPIDREKLLIALECCRDTECNHCPYYSETFDNCDRVAFDALAYICYLEEQLGVTGL